MNCGGRDDNKNSAVVSKSDEITIGMIIKKYKSTYKRFTPVYSPAIGEDVLFNMSGFKHLVFKNNRRRPNKVIYSRLVLIPLIKPVIHACEEVVEVRVGSEDVKGERLSVEYRALEARVGKGSARVRVVIKKIGKNGKYYFQSVIKIN